VDILGAHWSSGLLILTGVALLLTAFGAVNRGTLSPIITAIGGMLAATAVVWAVLENGFLNGIGFAVGAWLLVGLVAAMLKPRHHS
jgi:hypothetical protein